MPFPNRDTLKAYQQGMADGTFEALRPRNTRERVAELQG
jgi:hypothetical protein